MRILTFCFCLFTFLSQAQLTKYVNPFIGTGGTGHTFPGATTPFAMVQLSPDTRIDGSWEGCSGYHYSDSIIYGFSHTHLSGTGCSDYGDIAFMPYFSKTENFNYVKNNLLQAKFYHKNEKAIAGYYSVVLDDIPVKVELTATTRTGFQRYTFNEDGYGYIVLNLKHRDELLEGSIHKRMFVHLLNCYSGVRRSKAWAKSQELFYSSIINTNPSQYFIETENGNDTKLILQYKVSKGQQILIKTGISTVDEDAALKNLTRENSYWDFEKTKQEANDYWEKELKKIEVFDKNETNKTIFYTAMYHCMIHPSIMNDVDGRYKGRDGKIHKAEGFNYYTVFSLWDTHRALHPLLNIIDKKRSHDFVITFLKQFEQSGRLPMWELWNNETDCMIGFHSVSVILDAYRKQVITREELQQLWPAVKAEAMSNRFGLDKFREKGYLSVEDENESASKTLEYSYDMWCVSEIAGELGYTNDGKYFKKFENGFRELWNEDNDFIQPRKNGNWLKDFNPYEVNNNYTEANAWQYSFYHPHKDIKNYNLYELFKTNNKTQGRTQADITGLIGQYAHGNEPSHNYIYLLPLEYRLKHLKYVYDSFYTNKPDGLIGNEDCGQMSAWYVLSALGFYPTCPGKIFYTLGLPIFDSARINTQEKINFRYSFNLNKLSRIKIEDYKNFNVMVTKKGIQEPIFSVINLSSSISNQNNEYLFSFDTTYLVSCPDCGYKLLYSQAPIINNNSSNIFSDSLMVTIQQETINHRDQKERLKSIEKGQDRIFYKINNSDYFLYRKPFSINKSSSISAYFIGYKNDTSNFSTAHFYKRPHNYSIQLNCKYNKQYTADGDDGIIDGQYGEKDWRKGGWQGYQAQDFEAIIDMKEKKEFAEISANFLQDTRAWILFPAKVEFYTSDDNINYKLVQTVQNNIAANDYNVQTQKFVSFYVDRSLRVEPPNTKREIMRSARYIKVKAYNYGKLPEWHAGKGDDAFVFIDEIEIK